MHSDGNLRGVTCKLPSLGCYNTLLAVSCGRRPSGGKEILPGAFVSGDAAKDIGMPRSDIDPSSLAGGDEGVCDGGPHGRGMVPGEQEVLPPQGQRPDGILDAIVVDVVAAVQDVAA